MSRRISFQTKKFDDNHKPIAKGLVEDGCLEMSLHELGRGRPDLLTATPEPAPGVPRILIAFEIKSEHHHGSRHLTTLTKQQQLIEQGWPIHQVMTVEQARGVVAAQLLEQQTLRWDRARLLEAERLLRAMLAVEPSEKIATTVRKFLGIV